jgi:hypothetical protein
MIIKDCVLHDCSWITEQPTRDLAMSLLTWHVYEDHRDVWEWALGNEPPAVPDPRIPAVRLRMLAALQ